MADRPSAPLLKLLRDMARKKGLNTAAIATAMGVERSRARRVLAGTDAMTVDELLLLGGALELAPEDLALPDLAGPSPDEEEPTLTVAVPTPEEEDDDGTVVLDGFGNHPEQLFRAGFALGCDFMFLVAADDVADSGVPPQVLRQYAGRELPIKLDAAYHRYNDPHYDPTGVTLTLSFDALYTCTFPWSAFRQFIFFPEPVDPAGDPSEEEEAAPDGPVLRLVT